MKLAIKLPLASLTSLRGIPDDLDEGVRPKAGDAIVITRNGSKFTVDIQTLKAA